jgi:hypothetical protein
VALIFISASSDIAFPSLTGTLPSFPMHAAFPRSEYYDGSVPPAPSADVAPIPHLRTWPVRGRERFTDGSHVHCCPIDELGIRLYPCGIATATS